jgi:His-Xaa-Ser system radical SAM maturase HxsC
VIKLHARMETRRDAEPFVARIVRREITSPDPDHDIFFIEKGGQALPGYRAYLRAEAPTGNLHSDSESEWHIPDSLHHLTDGDIIRLSPRAGEIWVMYRRESPHNSMLLTELCNSYCVMCSQPPKSGDDHYLFQAYLEAIPLMSQETAELGITGGEPTLLGGGLLEVIQACKEHLPRTGLHILSNGRMFSYLTLCNVLAGLGHPDLVIGIPLYSDIAHRHDHVVQVGGAFDQTIRGIMNLARCGIPVEIRVVIHSKTADRLPQLARFIARNLPFATHIALMGLETTGFVRMNLDALWIDPANYHDQLRDAVVLLDRHGMNVSIYNHQLCVLDRSLWPFARRSISDWKNEYVEECRGCIVRDECCGFFSSASLRRPDHIRAVLDGSSMVEASSSIQSPYPVS